MSFDVAKAIFNQVDTNGDNQIDPNEFNQWLNNQSSNTALEASSFTSDTGATGVVSVAEASSSTNDSLSVQQYATDAQGYFLDRNPLVVRAAAVDCPQLYMQNVKVRLLQPPPLEPHGPLVVRQVRPPQPPVPPPVVIRRVDPRPKTPPPLVIRQHPPPKPAQDPSKTVTVTVANPPPPPRSVIRDITLAPPPKPRDVYIELWRQYPPRPPGRRVVIPAPPPKPYPPPRNQVIIRQCPPPRIAHSIQRLEQVQMNPETYYQQYSGSLLDTVQITEQIRAAGLPTNIVEQIFATIATSSTVTQGQDFSNFTSSTNFESSDLSTTNLGTSTGGIDVATAAFNSVDTNQDGSISRSEFAEFFQKGL